MILDIPDRVWGGWSMACSKANPAGVAGGMRCFEAYDWRRTDLRRGPLRHLGNDAALAAPTVARQPPELLEDARGLPVRRLFASACASSSAIIATSRSFRAKPSRKCTPLSLRPMLNAQRRVEFFGSRITVPDPNPPLPPSVDDAHARCAGQPWRGVVRARQAACAAPLLRRARPRGDK